MTLIKMMISNTISTTFHIGTNANGKVCHYPLTLSDESDGTRRLMTLAPAIERTLGKYEVPLIKKRNDFALWLKMLKDTPCCLGMQEILATYRIRSNSVSSNKLAQAQYHWQLYHDIERLGFIRSAWYVFCWAFVKGTGIGLKRRNI